MIEFMAVILAASAPQTELTWGCRFEEAGKSPFLIQGRLVTRDGFLADRPELAMEIIKDESGRYEGRLLRPPYFARPGPGKIWLVLNAKTDEGLLLDFPPGESRGTAQLVRGDFQNPIAAGICAFKEADA